ncbi:unnamed protein product [Zymoseptoria tritici ST99CH_3D1]|nr:unnamed protein product [Zymoseptoria tritici ST99CH_3D1]
MSNGQPIPTPLPSSYTNSPYTEIRISHHPADSPDPTPILICTLYRPAENNAFTDIMTDEIEHFFGLASIDDRVKAIVLTGQGKFFCPGQDLKQGFRLTGNGKNETEKNHRDGGGRASLAIHSCTKPTIAAINGHAVGVGITMTLPCTIRVVWSGAKIGFVFSQRGVIAEACSSFFLPRLIGTSRALQLAITGSVYPANHKAFDGLFSELVDRQQDVLPRALEVAELLAEKTSTVSTFMIREMFYRGVGSAEEAHLLESRVMANLRESSDNQEAVDAFMQKRPAKFTGSMQSDYPPAYPWFSRVDTKNRPRADPRTNAKPKL